MKKSVIKSTIKELKSITLTASKEYKHEISQNLFLKYGYPSKRSSLDEFHGLMVVHIILLESNDPDYIILNNSIPDIQLEDMFDALKDNNINIRIFNNDNIIACVNYCILRKLYRNLKFILDNIFNIVLNGITYNLNEFVEKVIHINMFENIEMNKWIYIKIGELCVRDSTFYNPLVFLHKSINLPQSTVRNNLMLYFIRMFRESYDLNKFIQNNVFIWNKRYSYLERYLTMYINSEITNLYFNNYIKIEEKLIINLNMISSKVLHETSYKIIEDNLQKLNTMYSYTTYNISELPENIYHYTYDIFGDIDLCNKLRERYPNFMYITDEGITPVKTSITYRLPNNTACRLPDNITNEDGVEVIEDYLVRVSNPGFSDYKISDLNMNSFIFIILQLIYIQQVDNLNLRLDKFSITYLDESIVQVYNFGRKYNYINTDKILVVSSVENSNVDILQTFIYNLSSMISNLSPPDIPNTIKEHDVEYETNYDNFYKMIFEFIDIMIGKELEYVQQLNIFYNLIGLSQNLSNYNTFLFNITCRLPAIIGDIYMDLIYTNILNYALDKHNISREHVVNLLNNEKLYSIN